MRRRDNNNKKKQYSRTTCTFWVFSARVLIPKFRVLFEQYTKSSESENRTLALVFLRAQAFAALTHTCLQQGARTRKARC